MSQSGFPRSRQLPATAQHTAGWYVGRPASTTARKVNRIQPAKEGEPSAADRAAAAVRQSNASDCLTVLMDAARPLTVSELADRSGLSRPTVDAVLRELIKVGSVRPAGRSGSSSPGRPARQFAADPSTTLVAGVDVGAAGIRCTVADAAGRVVARARTAQDPGTDRLEAIVDAVRRATEHVEADGRGARLAAVGLAVPAILDHDQRPVRSATFPQWTGVDLQSTLTRRLGCPVAVENDLKLAAYAEHHIGGAAENMIFLQLGRRISMALLVGGRILQGSHRMAGELGAQRGMRWTSSYDQLGLRWSTGRDAKPLFERAAAGDRQAIAEIEDFCDQITSRLATVVLALDPELLVIGGGLSLAGEVLLDPLRRRLDDLLTTPARPKVAAARLATDAAVTGALGHAFDQQSEQIFGIPAVPPPWYRLRTALRIRPRSQGYGSGTQ